MDNLNISILTDKFEAYYANAKKAQQENNVALAKRNYMLAAETMLKLAKISSPELKKARIERAKRLIDIAENLEAEMENSKDRRTSPAQSQTSKNDDEGKQWAAAEIPTSSTTAMTIMATLMPFFFRYSFKEAQLPALSAFGPACTGAGP